MFGRTFVFLFATLGSSFAVSLFDARVALSDQAGLVVVGAVDTDRYALYGARSGLRLPKHFCHTLDGGYYAGAYWYVQTTGQSQSCNSVCASHGGCLSGVFGSVNSAAGCEQACSAAGYTCNAGLSGSSYNIFQCPSWIGNTCYYGSGSCTAGNSNTWNLCPCAQGAAPPPPPSTSPTPTPVSVTPTNSPVSASPSRTQSPVSVSATPVSRTPSQSAAASVTRTKSVSPSYSSSPSSSVSTSFSSEASTSATTSASLSSSATASVTSSSTPTPSQTPTISQTYTVVWSISPKTILTGESTTVTVSMAQGLPAPNDITARFEYASTLVANQDYVASPRYCTILAGTTQCTLTVTSQYSGTGTLTMYPYLALSAAGSYSFTPASGAIFFYDSMPTTTASHTASVSTSNTKTASTTNTPTASASFSRTGTASRTVSPTGSRSVSSTRAASVSPSQSRSYSPSRTPTNTQTGYAVVNVVQPTTTIMPGGTGTLIATLVNGSPVPLNVTVTLNFGGSTGVVRGADFTASTTIVIPAGELSAQWTMVTAIPPPHCGGVPLGSCKVRVNLVSVSHATFYGGVNLAPGFTIN